MANEDVMISTPDDDDEGAMWVNLRNHFEMMREWRLDVGEDVSFHNYFNNQTHSDYVRKLANSIVVDHIFFRRCMRGWITQQSKKGHFMCIICGRQSTVDITALQMRKSPHGSGVCMCCLNMKGMPIRTFTDHATNDVFSQQVQKALYKMLPKEYRVDMLIDETTTLNGSSNRPDTCIYINRGNLYTVMFIECDPKEKKLTDSLNERDKNLTTADKHLNLSDSCKMAFVLRYETAINGKINTRTNLYQNIWQIIRLFAGVSQKILIGLMKLHDCRRLVGRMLLNYRKHGDFSIYGFRIHTDEAWLKAMVSPLMQPVYDSSINNIQGNPDIHDHRTILVEIMRGFNTNDYIAFYFKENPVIGFIANEQEEFVHRASPTCHNNTNIRYMLDSSASSVKTISMTPYSLRLGKEMLASMIFLIRHRVTSAIAPYRYSLVPQRVNRPTVVEKRPADDDRGPGEIMAVADFLSSKMYF